MSCFFLTYLNKNFIYSTKQQKSSTQKQKKSLTKNFPYSEERKEATEYLLKIKHIFLKDSNSTAPKQIDSGKKCMQKEKIYFFFWGGGGVG